MDIGYGALYSHLQMRSVQSLLQHLPTGSGDFKTSFIAFTFANPTLIPLLMHLHFNIYPSNFHWSCTLVFSYVDIVALKIAQALY